MSAPLIRSIGRLTVRGAQPSIAVDLPPRKVGDILFVHFLGLNFFSTNDGLPETPPGAEVLYTQQAVSSGEVWWAIRVLNAEAELTLEGGPGFNLSWAVQAWTVTNVTPSPTWYDSEDDDSNFFGNTFPAVTVSDTDRLVVGFIRGLQFFTAPGPFAPPGGFVGYTQNSADIFDIYYQYNLISAVTDASTPTTPYEHSNSSDGIFTIAIIGIDDSPLPALPQPGLVRLDCAYSYTAFITEGDYRTTIDAVGWSSINWGRILDEVSNAQVVIPDILGGVRCCIPYGGVVPWKYGLLIERNDVLVWNGPIRKVVRDPEQATTTLLASDVLARYMQRYVVRNGVVNWVNVDCGVAFAGIINSHARSSADAWFVEAPSVFTGASITRDLLPRQLTMAWDVMRELVGSAVDAYISNGVLYVWEPGAGWRYFDGYKRTVDGPYNSNFDLVFGLFTADSFAKLPSWSIDGDDMANFVTVPAADTGQLGFRDIWTAESAESQLEFGLLDYADVNTLSFPQDTPPSHIAAALQARANTLRDLRAMPPVVVSGGILAEGAPVDIEGLRPGSLWTFDVFDACYGQLRAISRLKSVEVSVSLGADGVTETISPTMYPPGFSSNEQFT